MGVVNKGLMRTDYLTSQLGVVRQGAVRSSKKVTAKKPAIEQKSVKWNKEQLNRALGPIVYIFWGISGEVRTPLYIGMSKSGIQRPLAPDHHMSWVRYLADECEFIMCRTQEEAEELEAKLIKTMGPTHNNGGK